MTTAANTAVTFDPRSNDNDPDGDALTIAGTPTPSHGAVVNNGGTLLTYTPASGYSGSDSFTYTISDGHGHTAPATVTVTITAPANSPPVAVDDSAPFSATTTLGHPVTATVTLDPRVNDSDPDGDPLAFFSVTQPASGHATVTIDGGGTSVTYTYNTPKVTLILTDTFTYTISDGHGHTAAATVTVDIDIETNQ